MKKAAFLIVFLFPFFVFPQQNSVLSSGDWYKIAVEKTGVYKITYDDLLLYGLDVENLDPQNLSLYGNKAGMLPESLETPYYTDLQQMAIQIVGEEDGSFDPEDYILFYGESPDVWDFDYATGHFEYRLNLYSDHTFYFITVGDEAGKRIPLSLGSSSEPNNTIDTLDLLIHAEDELVNIMKSGKRWLGEAFTDNEPHSKLFNLDDFVLYQDGHSLRTTVAANSTEAQTFDLQINGLTVGTIPVSIITEGQSLLTKYRLKSYDTVFALTEDFLEVSYIYNSANDSAIGWLDFISMNLKLQPVFNQGQMAIMSTENFGAGNVSLFSIETPSPANTEIWNVSDPLNVMKMNLEETGNEVMFKIENDSVLAFQAFDGSSFEEPQFIGQVENQNLHAALPPMLLIITYPEFLSSAQALATSHESEDEMSVLVSTTEQVYNEFSSGAQDITAIRNFVRYLKSENNGPEYLLLFGDASYDYKNRVEGNTNFVPTFETEESENIIFSYASDAYYGKINTESQMPQIGIGRLPVKNETEANVVVNKIMAYQNETAFGPWKNEWMFIADNGDQNLHQTQSGLLSDVSSENMPSINVVKNYLDFYNITQTNDGPRIPEVNHAITKATNEGTFYFNYNGHSGYKILAEEHILTEEDLIDWENADHLPLWVAASGPMALYDNPDIFSLGEAMVLHETGGAIGVLGNSVGTFASANFQQNMGIIDLITSPANEGKRLGDLIRYSSNGDNNSAKWLLLGDPALKLALPDFMLNTAMINGVPAEDYSDTIPPGSQLVLSGTITDGDENLQTGFNGPVYLKIYHPPMLLETTGSGGSTPVEISVQDSVLVSGSTTVENGEFEISVWLPAQYMEGFGNLKLSWYANTDQTDAAGYFNQLVYGGEPSGLGEPDEMLSSVKVYPTVFANSIYIEIPVNINQQSTFNVFNSMGQMVFSEQNDLSQGVNTIQLPNLSKGMYIVEFVVGGSSKNFKVFRN